MEMDIYFCAPMDDFVLKDCGADVRVRRNLVSMKQWQICDGRRLTVIFALWSLVTRTAREVSRQLVSPLSRG